MQNTSRKILFLGILFTFLFVIFNKVSAFTIVQTEMVSIGATVGSLPTIDPSIIFGTGFYQSGVRFSGLAYPNATVTVIKKDGSISTVKADAEAKFSIFVPENQWQLFTLFATDTEGSKSTLLNFPTILYSGIVTDISGIRFAPTINTDKLSIKQGDYLTVEGFALPNATVSVVFEGIGGRDFSLNSNSLGKYRATLPMSLSKGDYLLKSLYFDDTRTSKAIKITIGDASIFRTDTTANIPGDCNFDQRVTLVDFSVLAYWYGKDNPPRCVDTNNDGIINLVDFSILAFYWSG